MSSPIQDDLERLHSRLCSRHDGHVAAYIPELAEADPRLFGIGIATVDGRVEEVGATREIEFLAALVQRLQNEPGDRPGGGQKRLSTLSAGVSVGEMALHDGGLRSASARATQTTARLTAEVAALEG